MSLPPTSTPAIPPLPGRPFHRPSPLPGLVSQNPNHPSPTHNPPGVESRRFTPPLTVTLRGTPLQKGTAHGYSPSQGGLWEGLGVGLLPRSQAHDLPAPVGFGSLVGHRTQPPASSPPRPPEHAKPEPPAVKFAVPAPRHHSPSTVTLPVGLPQSANPVGVPDVHSRDRTAVPPVVAGKGNLRGGPVGLPERLVRTPPHATTLPEPHGHTRAPGELPSVLGRVPPLPNGTAAVTGRGNGDRRKTERWNPEREQRRVPEEVPVRVERPLRVSEL